MYTTCFDQHWSSSDVPKITNETAVLPCISSIFGMPPCVLWWWAAPPVVSCVAVSTKVFLPGIFSSYRQNLTRRIMGNSVAYKFVSCEEMCNFCFLEIYVASLCWSCCNVSAYISVAVFEEGGGNGPLLRYRCVCKVGIWSWCYPMRRDHKVKTDEA
jgi:hypothetical protein